MSISADPRFWLYCPECGFRVNGAAASTCPDCGAGMRIWKAKDGAPPPENVSTIKKRGVGM